MPVRWAFTIKRLVALSTVLGLVFSPSISEPMAPPEQQPGKADESAKLSPEQIDSLVAPIALYPDPLLAQVLAASTYPLELVQLQQWLAQNKSLKDEALVEAVEKQGWDPSVQAMAPLPDVVKRMTENIKWTTELGNAFLAQQPEVMDAVQRMRKKAQDKGALESSEQMKVENKTVDDKSVVVIEQADPKVVYVPSYNPTVIYGAPPYPYPPVTYPPPGYYAGGMFLSFTLGVAMGAAFSGGWGYNCGWGGANNVNINNNNTFVRNSNTRANRTANTAGRGGGNRWQHNPQHRGGTPYPNRNTADRFGGTTRGASRAQRQAGVRQQQRAGGSRQQAGISGRTSSDRIGNRSASPRQAGGGGGAFGGSSSRGGGMSGSGARASSSRGASSMRGGGRGGGGRRR